ncbi:MAG: hypothetical protein AAFY34_05425 [Pseudomonadota bacterium]
MSGVNQSNKLGEAVVLDRLISVSTKDSPLREHVASLKDLLEEKIDGIKAANFHDLYTDEIITDEIYNGRSIDEARHFYADFIRHLTHAQLAIIDLNYNPAAFYILGIRQTVSNGVTLALSDDGRMPAFTNARFAHKDDKPFEYLNVADPDWTTKAINMTEGLGTPQVARWTNDIQSSRAFTIRPRERDFNATGAHTHAWRYCEQNGDRPRPKIVIWKGDIAKARDFDVWVNSENTYMEMARFWDNSVSATIRKLGSVRQPPYNIFRRKDALGLALAEKIGTQPRVDIGEVFITPTELASDLSAKNKVQCVAHLASVEPNEQTHGFQSGGQIEKCIGNVFREVNAFRKETERRRASREKIAIKSILFPLIGSGDGGAHPSLVAHQMVICLRNLFEKRSSKFGLDDLDTIGIVAYLPSHFDYLVRELESNNFEPDLS